MLWKFIILKNKFGVGYHLTLVLETVAREDSITQLVTRYIRTAKKDRRHGRELSYILPHNTVDNFSSLFTAIENEISSRSNLGIASYGVSMTTLEEVFLRLQKEEQEAENVPDSDGRTESRNIGAQPEITRSKQLQSSSDARTPENEALTERISTLETVRCTPSTMQNIKTLIVLRILRLRRDWSKLIMVLVVPNFIAGFAVSLIRDTDIQNINIPKSEPIQLNIHMYNFQNISVYNEDNSEYFTKFKDQLEKLVVLDTYNGKFSSLLDIAPHLAAFNFKSFSSTSQSIAVLYNDTYVHNLPILVNLISNAFYRTVTPLAEISVSAHPFVNPAGADPPLGFGNMILGMIFIFAPIILAADMVYDREIKARNQLRVNGLSFSVYFISFFVVQVALMAIITAVLIILIYVLKPPSLSSGSSIIVLTLLVIAYCPASVLICTCISYIFDKADTAMSVMPNLALLFGIVPYIPVMYSDKKLASILHYVFTCIDIMYVPFGMLHYIQKVTLKCEIDDHCEEPSFSNFLIPEIIIIFIALLVQIPLWFLFLLMVDVSKSGGQVLSIFRSKKPRTNIEDASETVGLHEDQDVKNEKQRVKQLIRDPRSNRTVVTVDNLRKVYKKGEKGHMFNNSISPRGNLNVAIKSFSLAIDASEVFGLLGHNGAGKTTAMKIITAEESPTRGRVQIAGKNIVSSVNAVFQFLGYCPQYDAQWKDITVEEHLELYSRIRGVPDDFIEPTIDFYLTGLQLKEHKDKNAENCSGGTRRKLSYAMAMVGNPKIVLLDEPSTGMDPQSKRFLWDTILSNFRGSKGAILTTHSMEEADALCSRIGIMVKGELRCLGSTQHLKNLYGAGYTLEIKLTSEGAGDTEEKFRALKNFVFGLFPNAVLQDTFGDRLIFSIPQDSVRSLARCFKSLENAKRSLNIEEYSFSQTTLEQVFIKFAQEGEMEGD
ncbi:unnamed protein product [Diabrotica balteata]|uniref:ABC transporter domain-containing protein n=1 Tax=Diabrotica balteata TaxID=107213 RepID=A0A9N9SU80_DIABA|nr:unnamed protein product [Diabrotica balteata]